jgi:hypothetical protein
MRYKTCIKQKNNRFAIWVMELTKLIFSVYKKRAKKSPTMLAYGSMHKVFRRNNPGTWAFKLGPARPDLFFFLFKGVDDIF